MIRKSIVRIGHFHSNDLLHSPTARGRKFHFHGNGQLSHSLNNIQFFSTGQQLDIVSVV
jgi:hypothetical protein